MNKAIIFLMLLIISSVSVVAADPQISRYPIQSCSGSGELILYNGADPFIDAQEDVDFSTNGYDELLIFTRQKYYTWLKIKLDGTLTAPSIFWSDNPTLPDVKIYSMDTSGKSMVDFEAKVYNNGTRGIQAFILQNNENPFFNDGFEALWDDQATDTTYFYPGTYQYVFFDKYSFNKYPDYLANQPDNRLLTITVKDSNDVGVYTSTFDHPSPSGTQGVVVAEFDIAEEGWYTISVDTEDSVYWGLIPCEPEHEVPEFGVIAAGIALVGALAIFVVKRK